MAYAPDEDQTPTRRILPPAEIAARKPHSEGRSPFALPEAAPAPGAKEPPLEPREPARQDTIGQLTAGVGAGSREAAREIQALDYQKMQLRPPQFTPPPKPETKTNPLQEWGSAALVLMALGSRVSRKPRIAAMNAAASAINGLREGRQQEADNAYRTWEAESRNAHQAAAFELNAYKEIMRNFEQRQQHVAERGLAIDAGNKAKLDVLARAFQDAPMFRALQEGPQAVDSLIKKREDLQERELRAREMNSKFYAADSEYKQWEQTEEGQLADPATRLLKRREFFDRAGTGSSWFGRINLSPEQKQVFAERMANRLGKVPSDAERRRSPDLQEAYEMAIKMNPALSEADFPAAQRAVIAFATGKQGDTVRSLGTVRHHLNTLEEIGEALNQSDIPRVNAIANALAAETGQPAPKSWDAAKKVVGDEIAKVLVGSGAGALGDREKVAEILDRAASPAARRGAIDTLKKLIRGQALQFRHQYESATGKKDFDAKLGPEVAEFFRLNEPATDAPPAWAEEEAQAFRFGTQVPIYREGNKWFYEDHAPYKEP